MTRKPRGGGGVKKGKSNADLVAASPASDVSGFSATSTGELTGILPVDFSRLCRRAGLQTVPPILPYQSHQATPTVTTEDKQPAAPIVAQTSRLHFADNTKASSRQTSSSRKQTSSIDPSATRASEASIRLAETEDAQSRKGAAGVPADDTRSTEDVRQGEFFLSQ